MVNHIKDGVVTRWVVISRSPISQIVQPPNLLSVSRVLPIPVIYWCLRQSAPLYKYLALGLLGLALLTDALDGYLARRFRWQSDLGLILDPLADKILIGSLAVFLVMFRQFPVWMMALIIGRDLAIVGASTFLFFRPHHIVIPSNRAGKTTTTVTSVALLLYVLNLQPYGLWCLWLSALCIIISSSQYTLNVIPLLKQPPSDRGAVTDEKQPEPSRQTPVKMLDRTGS